MGQIMNSKLNFEDFKCQNGIAFWWASDLAEMLDYASFSSFQKAIYRATKTMISLNIPHYTNITPGENPNNQNIQDFKLTRFACYLIVMNADPAKEAVAKAQAYFVAMTREFEIQLENQSDNVERIITRDELAEGQKSLSGVVAGRGVQGHLGFAQFQNAGYVGMYNMFSYRLEQRRGIKKGQMPDHMGRAELAANLFRVTQTEERIKNKDIHGQKNLENTHKSIGSEIRQIVKKNTGNFPEDLPLERRLPEVKKELKKVQKGIQSIGSKKKPKKKKKIIKKSVAMLNLPLKPHWFHEIESGASPWNIARPAHTGPAASRKLARAARFL